MIGAPTARHSGKAVAWKVMIDDVPYAIAWNRESGAIYVSFLKDDQTWTRPFPLGVRYCPVSTFREAAAAVQLWAEQQGMRVTG